MHSGSMGVGGNQRGGGCKGLAGGGSKKKPLTCCSAGSGLALGFGVGGGVASERARVCGATPVDVILGQIQHECASLTPRMGIGAVVDMYPCSSQRCGFYTVNSGAVVFFWDLGVRLSAPDVLRGV